MADDHTTLRATFDQVASLYDQARPGYPAALFDDLVALSGIAPGGRILEIGCGTGQATLPLAGRGYAIDCVELGAGLAELARGNLAGYPRVQVYTGAFESWPLEAGAYDLAISATAFHWIDPAVRYVKVAPALRPPSAGSGQGGAIGLFWSHHVKSEADQDFFTVVQEVYEREAPEKAWKGGGLPTADQFVEPDYVQPSVQGEIARSGLFSEVAVRRYRWDQVYDAQGYTNLLNTYSDHLSQPDAERERLMRGIAEMIDTRFGGRITKGYLTILYVARRK